MSKNVVDFPKHEAPSLFGPQLTGSSLIVDGRLVPHFHIHDMGDKVQFILDGRLAFDVPKDCAHVAATMAANAMAIGAGYSHLGANDRDNPFAPEVHALPEVSA